MRERQDGRKVLNACGPHAGVLSVILSRTERSPCLRFLRSHEGGENDYLSHRQELSFPIGDSCFGGFFFSRKFERPGTRPSPARLGEWEPMQEVRAAHLTVPERLPMTPRSIH
jgi:hypothetical protein